MVPHVSSPQASRETHPAPEHLAGEATVPPAKAHALGSSTASTEQTHEREEEEAPVILHVATMTKSEKDKIRRIVTPKPSSGRIEVPEDVSKLWATPEGKDN